MPEDAYDEDQDDIEGGDEIVDMGDMDHDDNVPDNDDDDDDGVDADSDVDAEQMDDDDETAQQRLNRM